ncbi:hypothetical protein [Caudoviricetes sp.]|nr:hypothetical protein [Caudoviricetes sp.]
MAEQLTKYEMDLCILGLYRIALASPNDENTKEVVKRLTAKLERIQEQVNTTAHEESIA